MKKYISLILALVIMLSAFTLSGCGNNKKPDSLSTSATEAEKTPDKYSSAQLKAYLKSFTEGDNPLYGTWKIKGLDFVNYIFRNDGYAQMAMGSEADFAKLKLDTKNKTLGVAFVLGFNGNYNYSFSKDNKTLYLKSDSGSFTLKKQKDYNLIPKARKNPKIDKDILGWWKSSGKQKYFFGSDGIMYSYSITMETCYTYNAENGNIKAIYDYDGDVKIDIKYSYKNGKLTIDGNKFKKFTPKELA